MKEKVIVVSPKGIRPDFIYQNGKIVEQVNTPALPKLLYHYGHLVDRSDSQDEPCNRIIITSRRLKQGQVLVCQPTDDIFSVEDANYNDARITYVLTYDAGNYGAESDTTLCRSYRSLISTRKNIRRYCDLLSSKNRFKQFHLSWYRVYF